MLMVLLAGNVTPCFLRIVSLFFNFFFFAAQKSSHVKVQGFSPFVCLYAFASKERRSYCRLLGGAI